MWWNYLSVLCQMALAVLLVWIMLEDFRYRAVHWWLFALIALVVPGIEFKALSALDIMLNACIVLIQLSMLTIYFSAKEKKWINITHRYLGWGDILLWGVFCLLFSPLNFVLFFMSSLLFTGIAVVVWKSIRRDIATIPLAGLQAGALLLVWTGLLFSEKMSFRNDQWFEYWIMS